MVAGTVLAAGLHIRRPANAGPDCPCWAPPSSPSFHTTALLHSFLCSSSTACHWRPSPLATPSPASSCAHRLRLEAACAGSVCAVQPSVAGCVCCSLPLVHSRRWPVPGQLQIGPLAPDQPTHACVPPPLAASLCKAATSTCSAAAEP